MRLNPFRRTKDAQLADRDAKIAALQAEKTSLRNKLDVEERNTAAANDRARNRFNELTAANRKIVELAQKADASNTTIAALRKELSDARITIVHLSDQTIDPAEIAARPGYAIYPKAVPA